MFHCTPLHTVCCVSFGSVVMDGGITVTHGERVHGAERIENYTGLNENLMN